MGSGQTKRGSKGKQESLDRKTLTDALRYALALQAPRDVVASLVDRGLITDKKAVWQDVIAATLVANAAKGSIQHVREVFNRVEGLPQAKISIDSNGLIDDATAEKIFESALRKK